MQSSRGNSKHTLIPTLIETLFIYTTELIMDMQFSHTHFNFKMYFVILPKQLFDDIFLICNPFATNPTAKSIHAIKTDFRGKVGLFLQSAFGYIIPPANQRQLPFFGFGQVKPSFGETRQQKLVEFCEDFKHGSKVKNYSVLGSGQMSKVKATRKLQVGVPKTVEMKHQFFE